MREIFEKFDLEMGESGELVEYEVYVRNGVAIDDEGNREPAPGVPDGPYSGSEFSRMRPPSGYGRNYGRRGGSYGRRYRGSYGGRPARQPSGVDLERIAALELALRKRRLDFFRSIVDQLRKGRVLSDKQKVAVRRNLHKLRMHDEAKLFEGDIMSDEVIDRLDEYILDEKKNVSWPIGDKKDAKMAISYMAAGRGKASDYPKIKVAIREKYGKDKSIMKLLKDLDKG